MDVSRIILGPVVTEKAESQKGAHTYTLRVSPRATKVDIKNVLSKFYDVDVVSVRVMRVGGKVRAFRGSTTRVKRHPFKKVIVTLAPKSKTLDLTTFKNK